MQTRTKKTLTTAALGLAAVAAAAGSASAADLTGATSALGGLPVGQATGLVPGAADSTAGAQQAVSNGTAALPTKGLLPSGNHLSGNQVAPVSGLLGGLPAGGGILGG
ncbi:hypothetical protein [Actinacidiphila rubida]|uniref:ATP-binding protein n=1 Tax=Actinacidiphila rubida TaxID=310780 RepID=A0A1H8MRA6_9ACTN|nr:hypothetical protein [Actinacidiphila rubida]SEO19768.1 hypothetical protein SAMN05216267_1019149 [Actinacidiphila rubida]